MLATTWMPASRRASAVRLTSEDRVVFAVATTIARSTVRARDTAVESRSGLGADMIVRSYLSSSWPAASLAMRTSGSGGALTIVIREPFMPCCCCITYVLASASTTSTFWPALTPASRDRPHQVAPRGGDDEQLAHVRVLREQVGAGQRVRLRARGQRILVGDGDDK